MKGPVPVYNVNGVDSNKIIKYLLAIYDEVESLKSINFSNGAPSSDAPSSSSNEHLENLIINLFGKLDDIETRLDDIENRQNRQNKLNNIEKKLGKLDDIENRLNNIESNGILTDDYFQTIKDEIIDKAERSFHKIAKNMTNKENAEKELENNTNFIDLPKKIRNDHNDTLATFSIINKKCLSINDHGISDPGELDRLVAYPFMDFSSAKYMPIYALFEAYIIDPEIVIALNNNVRGGKIKSIAKKIATNEYNYFANIVLKENHIIIASRDGYDPMVKNNNAGSDHLRLIDISLDEYERVKYIIEKHGADCRNLIEFKYDCKSSNELAEVKISGKYYNDLDCIINEKGQISKILEYEDSGDVSTRGEFSYWDEFSLCYEEELEEELEISKHGDIETRCFWRGYNLLYRIDFYKKIDSEEENYTLFCTYQ